MSEDGPTNLETKSGARRGDQIEAPGKQRDKRPSEGKENEERTKKKSFS